MTSIPRSPGCVRWTAALALGAHLTVAPALAQAVEPPGPPAPANEIGVGAGESTGLGLLYQRRLGGPLRVRANLGAWPRSDGWPLPGGGQSSYYWLIAGGGVLADVYTFPGGALYLLAAAQYKRPVVNEVHRSITPGLGVQFGPVLLELGVTAYDTKRDGGGGRMYVQWGYTLGGGLGLVWGF